MFSWQLRGGVISCQVRTSPLGDLPEFAVLKAQSTPHGPRPEQHSTQLAVDATLNPAKVGRLVYNKSRTGSNKPMPTTPATLAVVRGIPLSWWGGVPLRGISLVVERRAALNYYSKESSFSGNRTHNEPVHRASTHSMKMGSARAVCDK